MKIKNDLRATNLRGTLTFKICSIRTTMKRFYITVKGVKQWSKLNMELK